jgi:hypothetical protein
VDHLREVQGADSLHTRRYHRLLEQVVLQSEPGRTSAFTDPNTLHVPTVNHRFFNVMNVRYVTTDQDAGLPAPFRKVEDAELSIWENPNAFGPAWISGESDHEIDDIDSALTAIGSAKRNESLGRVTVTSFAPHRVKYDVDNLQGRQLVTSEIYFPGWSARVDGRPSPVETASWILRATPVSVGRHTVEFTYEPASYHAGLYLTCASLGFAASFCAFRWSRQKPTI